MFGLSPFAVFVAACLYYGARLALRKGMDYFYMPVAIQVTIRVTSIINTTFEQAAVTPRWLPFQIRVRGSSEWYPGDRACTPVTRDASHMFRPRDSVTATSTV